MQGCLRDVIETADPWALQNTQPLFLQDVIDSDPAQAQERWVKEEHQR